MYNSVRVFQILKFSWIDEDPNKVHVSYLVGIYYFPLFFVFFITVFISIECLYFIMIDFFKKLHICMCMSVCMCVYLSAYNCEHLEARRAIRVTGICGTPDLLYGC